MRISDWSSDVCSSDLVHMEAGPLTYVELSESADGSSAIFLIFNVSFGGIMLKKQAVLIIVVLLVVEINFAKHADRKASCRERVCQYGLISGVGVYLKKKKTNSEIRAHKTIKKK